MSVLPLTKLSPLKHFEDDSTKSNKSNKPISTRKSKKSIPIAGECDCKIIENTTIDWYCTKGCGCLKINSQCSVLCECKGACSNIDKIITEELFFKVWRNIVLRKTITGVKRIEIIKQKEDFKKELIETLELYNIEYYKSDIIQYTKLLVPLIESKNNNGIGSSCGTDYIKIVLNKYFQIEKEKRLIKIRDTIENHKPKCLFRPKSQLIINYINTLLPDDQLKLPSIQEIIIHELDAINLIKQDLKSIFIKEKIGWMYRDEIGYVPDFIVSGSTDYQSLVFQFRTLYRIYN